MTAFTANLSNKGEAAIDEIVADAEWPTEAAIDAPHAVVETLSDRRTVGRDRIAATYGVATHDDYNTGDIADATADAERAKLALREILEYDVAFVEGAKESDFPNTEV